MAGAKYVDANPAIDAGDYSPMTNNLCHKPGRDARAIVKPASERS